MGMRVAHIWPSLKFSNRRREAGAESFPHSSTQSLVFPEGGIASEKVAHELRRHSSPERRET